MIKSEKLQRYISTDLGEVCLADNVTELEAVNDELWQAIKALTTNHEAARKECTVCGEDAHCSVKVAPGAASDGHMEPRCDKHNPYRVEKHQEPNNEWFERGRNSVLRERNTSGCACVVDEHDDVIVLCSAHADYIKKHQQPSVPEGWIDNMVQKYFTYLIGNEKSHVDCLVRELEELANHENTYQGLRVGIRRIIRQAEERK